MNGNARPLCHNIRDVVLRNQNLRPLLLSKARCLKLRTQFLLMVAQTRRRLIVLPADRGILLLHRFCNLCAQPHELIGIAHTLHTHARCRLVHEVNRLVRETAIRDVTLGEAYRCTNGGILNVRMVKLLVFAAQTKENFLRILLVRLIHQNRLKATCQCRVLCKVLFILAECRRADDLHLPTRKGRL